MKTRIIHTKIWQDDWFYNLSSHAQRLFLYCITNQQIGLSGAYELPERVILFDLKLTTAEFESLKLELKEKALFSNGWVIVPNANKYNPYSGAKNFIAYTKEIEQLPVDISKLLTGLSTTDSVSETKNTVSQIENTTINHKSVIINHKSDDTVSGIEVLRKKAAELGGRL